MSFLDRLFNKNKRLKLAIVGPTIMLVSTITLPTLAQLPRFDSPVPTPSPVSQPAPVPESADEEEEMPSSTTPSTSVPTQPSEAPVVIDSTAPLPGQRQSSIGIIKPVNGFVNIKLTNNTAATISYEVVGDTSQRQLSGNSEVILRTLKVPVNITFYRQKGGFLLIKPLFFRENGMLELTLTETNDFNLDRSSLLIEETGNVFLN